MKKTVIALFSTVFACSVSAQQPGLSQAARDRLLDVQSSIQTGDVSKLSEKDKAAIASGTSSAKAALLGLDKPAANLNNLLDLSSRWAQSAKEAYIQALPKRDQPYGRRFLLGDQTDPEFRGSMYIFVSRSMPMSLLKAYAVDALYLNAPLVVKGIRPGDTLKEYFEEAIEEFNSAEGQTLAAMQINPNLYDMFNVTTVPTVVWTSALGLDDQGAGCAAPEGPVPELTLKGPEGTLITAPRPVCAAAPETSFVKISGALSLDYVLERFQEAGVPKTAIAQYRQMLAEKSSVYASGQAQIGVSQGQLTGRLILENIPSARLIDWKTRLAESKTVQRSPLGPVFDGEGADDPLYRSELTTQIEHQLGVRK